MKLATFVNPRNETVIGAVDIATQTVLDLQAAHQDQHSTKSPFLTDMLALMDAGDTGLALARGLESSNAGLGTNRYKLKDIKLLSPVPVPRQIRDFNNAEGHMRNAPAGMAMLNAKLKGLPVPKRSDVEVVIPDVNFSQPISHFQSELSQSSGGSLVALLYLLNIQQCVIAHSCHLFHHLFHRYSPFVGSVASLLKIEAQSASSI